MKRSGDDLFADITQQFTDRWTTELEEPQPPPRPERRLPTDPDCSAAFTPPHKIRTAEELEEELARWREKMAPFMADLAPKAPALRERLAIEAFDWRLATDDDVRNFAGHTLTGGGEWERVAIPHYGGPIGRATAYYRAVVRLDDSLFSRGSLFLRFKGVDYKAHAFLNGSFIGSHEGFFAPFEFDVTTVARPGANTLVVRVENDAAMLGNAAWGQPEALGDKIYAATGPGWDDPDLGWSHCPPGMGIYQDVMFEARATAFVSDIFARPLADEDRVEVHVEVFNATPHLRPLFLSYAVHGQNFDETVVEDGACIPHVRHVPGFGDMDKPGDGVMRLLECGPGPNTIRFVADIPGARRWSPEEPWLYQLQVELREPVTEERDGDGENGRYTWGRFAEFSEDVARGPGRALDRAARQFGMRSFRMEEKEEPKGRFYLNGREVRLRGTNTMGNYQQDVIAKDWDQLRDDLLLAKICNMNYIRFTQRPVQEEIYDHCDRLGIMTQCDLPMFGCLRRNQFEEALRQCAEMERLVRGHPCNVMVSYINEPFPNGHSMPHRNLDHDELRAFFDAADIVIRRMNPDRVIKAVDGDYDPPSPGLPDRHCYNGWYANHGIDLGRLHKGYWQRSKKGWSYACGEFGAEGLDPVDLMRRRYPAAWLPGDGEPEADWTPSRIKGCQTGRFHNLWFEAPHGGSMQDWVDASHEHQEWAVRTVTEAFRRDRRMTSFCIHLFIDAFPASWMKVIMDVERRPKPAYFAYREALAPLNVHWRADRTACFGGEALGLEAWVCNDRDESREGWTLRYQFEVGGEVVCGGVAPAFVPACSSECQGLWDVPTPTVERRAKAVARIALVDAGGGIMADGACEVVLFPRPADARRRVCILGPSGGEAARVAAALGLTEIPLEKADGESLLLIDSQEAWRENEEAILRLVEVGATAALLQVPVGVQAIAGDVLRVEPTSMGRRHFVDRSTGHPLVEGLGRNDLKFLYDGDAGHVTPFLGTAFEAPGWTPILTTGVGPSGNNTWKKMFAAAEKRVGRGCILISQMELASRLDNPAVRTYATNLARRRAE